MHLISDKTVPELLELHAAVLEELRARNILHRGNAPAGDYAEYLFCKAFGWVHCGASRGQHDARGTDSTTYQISGRRQVAYDSSPRLHVLPSDQGFDYLAAILFDKDFHVSRGGLIPADVVRAGAHPDGQSDMLNFYLLDFVWDIPGVKDVTAPLQAVASGHPVQVAG